MRKAIIRGSKHLIKRGEEGAVQFDEEQVWVLGEGGGTTDTVTLLKRGTSQERGPVVSGFQEEKHRICLDYKQEFGFFAKYEKESKRKSTDEERVVLDLWFCCGPGWEIVALE